MKKELQKEYEHYIEINQDGYSKAVVKAGEAVMKLKDGEKGNVTGSD